MENKQNLLAKEKTTKQNRIWVRIAAACNNKCIFCLDSDAQNGTFPPEEEVKIKIQEGFKPGWENRVIISGGEASINPKFPEYIRYAKELGYDRVQTVTNGNMFFLESFCTKVFDAGLEEVTFSFHGHTSALHDYLVATPGAFKKSLKGLIYVKKYYPHVIINVDVVINKVNVAYLPDIVKFFMRLGVYEFDLLQIIPFGRGFSEYKSTLFYNAEDYQQPLLDTWKLSRIPGMYMWTNRFPAESFEGYEDLIQDPRKIKSEVMGESIQEFRRFVQSKATHKPHCWGNACNVCFQNQYCHDFVGTLNTIKQNFSQKKTYILEGQEFPSLVYEKFGETQNEFKAFIQGKQEQGKEIINLPKCLMGSGKYQTYNDIKEEDTVEDYTYKYIQHLYRKKSLRCKGCKYNQECKGIHINFIRSYGFKILQPIT